MATPRTLIHLPPLVRRGDVIEIRTTLAHPMENGLRVLAEGNAVPRDIVTRFEARLDTRRVFAADTHAAIAANPYFAFFLRVEQAGTLTLLWEGDHGFQHRLTVPLKLT